jgi:ABC-type Na+ transport system ATPase subunit NatA
MSSATRLRIEVGQRPDNHHPDACGLVKPDGGGRTYLGLDIIRDAPQIRLQIGYMTQRFSFYEDLMVAENLDFVAEVYQLDNSRTAVKAIVDRMDLADRADQLAGELSGGWKQRLALAACVLHKPKLLLDEPTAGVDAKARREFSTTSQVTVLPSSYRHITWTRPSAAAASSISTANSSCKARRMRWRMAVA